MSRQPLAVDASGRGIPLVCFRAPRRRVVRSPPQEGEVQSNDLWANGLPGGESQRGQEHAVEAGGAPKAFRASSRKPRAAWQRLDCLNPRFLRWNASPPDHNAYTSGPSGYSGLEGVAGTLRPVGDGERPHLRNRTGCLPCATTSDTRKRGIPYGARALGERSPRSSPRTGKPPTWRRGQVSSIPRSRRHARCVTPKRSLGSSANVAGQFLLGAQAPPRPLDNRAAES